MGEQQLPPRRRKRSFRDLLSWQEVDPVFREPFILTGYRHSGTSWRQCLQYSLVLHNEVGNFWTHFIPLIVWLVWLLCLALSWEGFWQPYHYPLLCFWFGSCSYAFFSSMAHLFSCKSSLIRTISFLLDYHGIAMYILGGAISSLFYLSATASACYRYKIPILVLEVFLAILAVLIGGLTRFYWEKYRFVVRVSAYFLLYLFSFVPFAHRVYGCWSLGRDCIPQTNFWHGLIIFLTYVLVFFFVTKIPERFVPGKFDYFFQSHQLFHVCSASVTTLQMYVIPLELQLRRVALSRVPEAAPGWETTFLPLACAHLLGLLVVCVLGYLTWNGTLIANKGSRKKAV